MQSAAQNDTRTGTLLGGKYQILRLIGHGGMGAVYEAENSWTRRQVAIKILHPQYTQKKEVVARFLQEAQTASQIRHPNIMDVLDMGQDPSDGSLYIVQEFLDGSDLRGVLEQQKRLPPDEVLDIVVPLMGALAAAHRRGVVHRDIKPENIFLTRTESGDVVPKIIDFGISKIVAEGSEGRNVTQLGIVVGTPNYMSPEQARGEAHIDGQTDVWSLGVVLYEMLAGRLPFDAPNQNMLLMKIMMGSATRLEVVAPDLPLDLCDIVHLSLSTDCSCRFKDMAGFIAAIIQSSIGGPHLFERHRRSISVIADQTGRFQALAQSIAITTPESVSPIRKSNPSIRPSSPSMRMSAPPPTATTDNFKTTEMRRDAYDDGSMELTKVPRAMTEVSLTPPPIATPMQWVDNPAPNLPQMSTAPTSAPSQRGMVFALLAAIVGALVFSSVCAFVVTGYLRGRNTNHTAPAFAASPTIPVSPMAPAPVQRTITPPIPSAALPSHPTPSVHPQAPIVAPRVVSPLPLQPANPVSQPLNPTITAPRPAVIPDRPVPLHRPRNGAPVLRM